MRGLLIIGVILAAMYYKMYSGVFNSDQFETRNSIDIRSKTYDKVFMDRFGIDQESLVEVANSTFKVMT
jgi:hypothetical protein